jgi:hypothetical protein
VVSPESTGINIAFEIVITFIDALVSNFGRVIIDDIGGGFFDVFFTFIFGGGLSIELAFLLVFSLFLLGFFYKYIYSVVN